MFAETSNDTIQGLFSQLPPQLVLNVCTAFVLLVALLIYFAYIKPSRARRQLDEREAMLRNFQYPSTYAASGIDLPDLDMLTNPDALPKQKNDDLAYNGSLYDFASTESLGVTAARPIAPAAPILQSGAEYRVKLGDGATARAAETITILRDKVDNRLMVYLDGVGYRSLTDKPEIKQRFTALMRELAESVAQPDTPREPEEIDIDALAADEEPAFTPPPAMPTNGKLPGDLPDFTAETGGQVVSRGARRPKFEPTPIPEINIAAAIEAYLQHKLSITPAYAARQIHVHSAPGGGVRIQVDNRFYDAVDEIDDPAVRQFIATTIEEWQARQ